MLIDTHCHLNFEAFNNDLPDVVRRAQDSGVEKMIIPGTDLVSSRRAIEIAQTYDSCFAAVGIHPHHAQDPDFAVDKNLYKTLSELITNDRVVAVGEIGLDYFRYKKTKYLKNEISQEIIQKQKDLFSLQLELAVIHNKPLILHCREAFADQIALLKNFSLDNSRNSLSHLASVKTKYITPYHFHGVFHCFTGSSHDLQLILTMGYYVGFDGNITFDPPLSKLLVTQTPLDKILIETDSPFLTPIPYRGHRNEPKNVKYIAQAIASYHSSTDEEVINTTTKNATSLFGI